MADLNQNVHVEVNLNGQLIVATVPARENLADFIRHRVGLMGTNVGCEQGICGACTVRLDGEIVRSCLTLVAKADGHSVETIEGLTDSGEIADLQNAFLRNNAAQCGFCTPAMLITAAELLETRKNLDRKTIREFLSGNLCRCTGYHAIVDAIEQVVAERGDA
ncbi:MAG: carbon-monoxide dehydrogenase small subunit [Gammaproteobacteria bacterium]|jgi:carbon-monoxide dehydrogenase small subunit